MTLRNMCLSQNHNWWKSKCNNKPVYAYSTDMILVGNVYGCALHCLQMFYNSANYIFNKKYENIFGMKWKYIVIDKKNKADDIWGEMHRNKG